MNHGAPVLVFDIETIPDVAGLRRLHELPPELSDAEVAELAFQKRRYDNDGSGHAFDFQYGIEKRLNAALSYRLHTDAAKKLRVDGNFELNYLVLGRDKLNGVGEEATGGKILYVVPGIRLSMDKLSIGVGLKKPVAKRLNEVSDQQGAEGVEKYRLIFSASMLFQ